jgi:hypothetical protein
MYGATPTLRELPATAPDLADCIAAIQSLDGHVYAGDLHASLYPAVDSIRRITMGAKHTFFPLFRLIEKGRE